MKKSAPRSGMTIVEFVILFATVAILIGTLMPDRDAAGAESALSADKSIINEMNSALSSNTPVPSTLDEAIKTLEGAGFKVNDLSPKSEDCVYVWGKSERAILLVKESQNNKIIIYPEKYVDVQYDPDEYLIITDTATKNKMYDN